MLIWLLIEFADFTRIWGKLTLFNDIAERMSKSKMHRTKPDDQSPTLIFGIYVKQVFSLGMYFSNVSGKIFRYLEL